MVENRKKQKELKPPPANQPAKNDPTTAEGKRGALKGTSREAQFDIGGGTLVQLRRRKSQQGNKKMEGQDRRSDTKRQKKSKPESHPESNE